MRAIWTPLVLLFLGSFSAAVNSAPLGPPAESLRGIDVGSIDRPEADAVVLYRGVHIRLDADGRVTRRVRLVQRLMTDHAISVGGDPRVAYDTTRQELSIDVCRTFMLDGKEVRATAHAFNRVTPERVASCPDRIGLQEMVMSYVGVERGCMTELDYTLTDRVPWRPWLEGIEELGGPYPVVSGELWIETPTGVDVHAQTLGWLEGIDRAPGPFCVPMSEPWRYGPIPARPDEGGLTREERVPTVLYSTGSWKQLVTTIRDRLQVAAESDSAILDWARGNLPGGRPPLDDTERLERIAILIGERTMPADDAPQSWMLPVRPASRTFAVSCGNLLDCAALCMAALRASGIDGTLSLCPAGRSTPGSPVLECFDDIRFSTPAGDLSVREGKAALWIDPAPATELLALDASAEGTRIAVEDGSTASRLSLRIVLDRDGSVRGEASIDARGGFVAGLGCRDLKAYLAGLASEYAVGGELAGYRVEEAGPRVLRAVFSFTGKSAGPAIGGGRRTVAIPPAPGFPQAAIPPGVSYGRQSRRTPLVCARPIEEDVTLRIELPEGTRAVIAPSVGDWKGGLAALESSWTRLGDAWIYHRRFRMDAGRVSPSEYAIHRAVMVRRLEEAANHVVLVTGTAN